MLSVLSLGVHLLSILFNMEWSGKTKKQTLGDIFYIDKKHISICLMTKNFQTES